MSSKSFLVCLLLTAIAHAAVDADLIPNVPGFGSQFKQKVWSGYLKTASDLRKLHYVLVESSSTSSSVPLTLWLNGGPGCSSLFGFLQQIGPYFLQEGANYKPGDRLNENPFSWHKQSHLLFIESPAGVGYSINNDPKFQYTDQTTAQDNIDALLDFFTKYPELSSNTFWLAGENYAGKYIPDLAYKIDLYNMQTKSEQINLKGILVGNGVMSFQNGEIDRHQTEYMIDHEFVDPDLLPYYRGSCLADPQSAGCRYFTSRFLVNVDEINPYNVYGYCFYNSTKGIQSGKKKVTQETILRNIIKNKGKYNTQTQHYGPACSFVDGLYDYFNAHVKEYHGVNGRKWNGVCDDNITFRYSISLRGSMAEYKYILDRPEKFHVILYSGDWDDVIPYADTLSNIQKLRLDPSYLYLPFSANGQHAGWTQVYGGLLFVLMKGASHQVPQSKRAEAFELFRMAMQAHNNPYLRSQ